MGGGKKMETEALEGTTDREQVEIHRSMIMQALVRELQTGIIMCNSGYYIPSTGTRISESAAADVLSNPRLMGKIKAQIRKADES